MSLLCCANSFIWPELFSFQNACHQARRCDVTTAGAPRERVGSDASWIHVLPSRCLSVTTPSDGVSWDEHSVQSWVRQVHWFVISFVSSRAYTRCAAQVLKCDAGCIDHRMLDELSWGLFFLKTRPCWKRWRQTSLKTPREVQVSQSFPEFRYQYRLKCEQKYKHIMHFLFRSKTDFSFHSHL